MYIKATREFHDDMGKVVQGQVIEVDDAKGADLIRLGLAENAQEAGAGGTGGPTSSAASNAPTGAAGSQSSSVAGQAPQAPASASPAGGQTSLPSTTAAISRPGRGASTLATGRGGKRDKARSRSKG